MGSGTAKTASGGFYATGAAMEIRGLGFKPTRIELHGEDMDTATWCEPMLADTYFNRVPDGTGSYVTTEGITSLQDGFDLGVVVDINVAGELVYWYAWE